MINRLLARFHTPRRHMAFLVGLLALVMILTVVIAWRANDADRARITVANAAVEESAALALGTWSSTYQDKAGNTLFGLARDVANPGHTIDTLLEFLSPRIQCDGCESPNGAATIFIVDAITGEAEIRGEPLPRDLIDRIEARIRAGDITIFHERIKGGVYFIEDSGDITMTMAFLTLGLEGTPMRITGAVLTEEMSTRILEAAFSNTRERLDVESSTPRHPLFEGSAYVGSTLFHGAAAEPSVMEVDVGAPVYGLRLALSPLGPGIFTHEPGTAERTTLFVLMVMITALLITAMAQVRRDAMLSRLRADFVASVSHELRTPLAQIRMFTETLLLGRVRTDIERRRSLEIIDQEARRLAHLVENVLLFAKAEGGRRTRVTPEPMAFTDEIRRAIESLSLLCRKRGAEIRAELQDGITVPVDGMALRQIMVNLVDNALKYGPSGQRITVGAALFDNVARVWVDDEGVGIPVADRERVFDSFYRLPRDAQSRIAGSGIGLAVVRELAVLHGGRAWAEGAPGGGARIVVEFPDAWVRNEVRPASIAAAS